MLSVCALQRLMGICSLWEWVFPCTSVLCPRDHISHRTKILFIDGIFCGATSCTSSAPFPAPDDLSSSLHSAAVQTAGSIQHFFQEPDKNKSLQRDGLPTHNRVRRKCKCRALHSRSAVSRFRRDSQIIFNVGARKSTLQLFLVYFFFRLCPPFCHS